MASSARLLILSNDHIFSEGLRQIVAPFSAVRVLDAGVAAEFVIASDASVLILDSRLTGALGMCARLRDAGRPAVILAAAPGNDNWAVDAISAGARGILFENSPLDDVMKAVEIVRAGQIWAPRHVVAGACMRHVKASTVRESESEAILEAGLSVREREVLRFAASGLGNRELATRLSISEATVKVHLMHIFRKLGVRRRGELAAAYHGLVRPGGVRPTDAQVRRLA
jgi:DNA-binding NarL/FixJ family response regulator